MTLTSRQPTALTLVLSSARSGSTLLCRDIASLGGLGAPREYLKNLAAQSRDAPLSEADILERFARGCRDDQPDVAAVKLMVPQAPAAYEAVTGHRAARSVEAMAGVVTWARERFERVIVVMIVRNALDQAISRVVAEATGVYHSSDRAFREGGERPLEIADVNRQILAEMGSVVRTRTALELAFAAHADISLLLSYEELIQQVDDTTSRLVAHARAHGLEVRRESVTRRMQKVVSAERASALRSSFLDYIQTETGLF